MRLRYGSSNIQYSAQRTSSAEPEHERHEPDPEEEPERVVEREAAHDRRTRAAQVLPHALRQPRRPRVRVDPDRHARHRQTLGLGLHERLHRVAVPAEHLQPQRRVAAHRPEPAGRVADGRAREPAHHPRAEPLQPLLQARRTRRSPRSAAPPPPVGALLEHRSRPDRGCTPRRTGCRRRCSRSTSAPAAQAQRRGPVMNAAASPRLRVWRTT